MSRIFQECRESACHMHLDKWCVSRQHQTSEFRKALKGREFLSRHLTLKHRTCDSHPLYLSPIDHTGFVVWAGFHTWTCRNLESEDSLNRRQLWGRGWACLWVFLFVSTLFFFQLFSVNRSLFVVWPPSPSSVIISLPSPPSLNLALVFPPPSLLNSIAFPSSLPLTLSHSLVSLSSFTNSLLFSPPLQIKILTLPRFHCLLCPPFISSVSVPPHPRRHCFSSPFTTIETEETTLPWQQGSSFSPVVL